MAHEAQLLAVVVRYSHYDVATPEQCVDLMRWYTNLDDADAEAVRLNKVRVEGVEYFVKILQNRSPKRPAVGPVGLDSRPASEEEHAKDGERP